MADEADGAGTITPEEEVLPEGIDDPQVLRAEIAKKDKAIRQIHARAIKAETLLKERTDKTEEPIINPTVPSQLGDRDYVDLRMQGYTAQDIVDIQKFGGMEALKDPNSLLSQGIKALRDQRLAEEAAAGTNQAGGEDQFREVNFSLPKNPSLKDLKGSLEKMEQALPHAD